ncbi:hypothetical protein EG329_012437 [Mollisiaceae sp. DMI_Dod_QoI]|nr:hypothetical protein EG329_012437 [Helotiales sp. DMI_Dod_QoI]
MKFAKELEQDLVPEWRIKYLDYKAGKKHVKAVARAFHRMNATPRTPALPNPLLRSTSIYGATSPFTPRAKPPSARLRVEETNDGPTSSLRASPAPLGADSRPESDASEEEPTYKHPKKTPPMAIPAKKQSPSLQSGGPYGSFVPTPPARPAHPFELPGPALTPQTSAHDQSGTVTPLPNFRPKVSRLPSGRSVSVAAPQHAYEVGPTLSPRDRNGTFNSLRNRIHQSEPPFMRRMFSVGTPLTLSESRRLDIDMVGVDQLRQRQKDFFKWMDEQLDKVETFYKAKEDEAGERLKILREQLHVMRNRRIEEVAAAQHAKTIRKEDERNVLHFQDSNSNGLSKKDDDYRPGARDHLTAWLDPFERAVGQAKAKLTGPHPGSNSKALQNMQESPELHSRSQADQRRRLDEGRDYVRRPHYSDEIPYRTAKRKLKLALQEFYRGMELLKSYALLNRTAFRKINKKYDKAIDAHPPLRFMSEKVNKAWFVQSDVLDSHLHAVEDLYARYFERGNHKVAVGKLRTSLGRPADRSMNAFQNGLFIGTGAVFAIQGVIYGAELLFDDDPIIRVQTSYLLQIYAGYFLALYLFAWFCLDCSIWSRNKINYQIDQKPHTLAIFITFSALNSIYTSIWDLFMDWSLLQPHAHRKYLRDVRGFKNQYWYYLAMILDPILRFNWIPYAIYTHDIQHSTVVSFFVSFSEVSRRGMWTLFRVENEHCANVAHFKASRDVPLPYSLPSDSQVDFQRTQRPESAVEEGGESTATSPEIARRRAGTGAQLEAQESRESVMRQRPVRTFTSIVADAHTQDFEKKRKPESGERDSLLRSGGHDDDDGAGGSSDEEEEDEEDEQDVLDAEELLRDRRRREVGDASDGTREAGS